MYIGGEGVRFGQAWRRWSPERAAGCKTGQNNRRVTFPARAAAHFVQSAAGPRLERKERVPAGCECKVQPTTGWVQRNQVQVQTNLIQVQGVRLEQNQVAGREMTGCDNPLVGK